jgi:uncharacterized membrane-anchored protein
MFDFIEETTMIIYFITALLIGLMIFKLGSYSIVIAIMAALSKFFAALVVVVGMILLYRKFKSSGYDVEFISHGR